MLAKKTLLMWLMIATIKSVCDEGCVRCGEDDKCLTCDLKLGWKLVGDSCQRNVDTKCILNGAQDSCLLCNQNFFYDATQRKCVRSSRRLSLCLHMQDNSLCDVCVKGYYPLDGVCTLVPKPIDNCKYHRDEVHCMQCEEGYWLSSNFKKCVNDPNNEALDNCKYYSNLYCEQCKDGTVPNKNNYIYTLFANSDVKKYQRYVQNMQFQYSDNVIDAQCENVQVLYCKKFKSAVECQECNNGYYLKEGQCIVNPFTIIDHCVVYSAFNKCQQCEPQYYPHNDQSECRQATSTIENCQIRNLNNCLKCYDGYYLSGSSCNEQIQIDNCDTYSTTSAKCTACVTNYKLTNDSLKCLPAIENCKTYASSNKNDLSLTCTACTNSTYLNDSKQCVSGGVVNCLEYQVNGQSCQKCVNGYYLNNNQCIQHMNIENCSVYSGSLKDTCVECQSNHFLFSYEKVCYAAFEIVNCAAYSDRDTCSKCDQGYYLDNNECVVIPKEEHCLERGAPNSDCLKCEEGYYINTSASPKVCVLQFEQQQLGCFTKSTDVQEDRHICSVCKGSHYFVDLVAQSNQTTFEGNICGKIDRVPEAQRVDFCVAYIDNGTDDWKCLRCESGYFLSDVSGNSNGYGDTCSTTCTGTIKVLQADFQRDNPSAQLIELDDFKSFRLNICVSNLAAPNDECEYWVPINKTTGNSFDYRCGKKKDSSTHVLKLNYAAGEESAYGFDGNFNLPARHGYAAPTYTLDSTTISTSYPADSDAQKCESWKVNPAGNNNKYCDKCMQQYSSKATVQDLTDATTQQQTSYLSCDTLIPDCETDVLGGFTNDYGAFIRHKVNPMHMSCHTCSSQNQIPFIHLPLDADAKWSTQWYQPFKVEETTDVPKDSPVKDGMVTQCREPTPQGLTIKNADFTREFPSNCAMGLFNVSISKTFKDTDALTDVSIFCLACKPGFKAVYNTDGFLSNCEEIANCQKTTTESVDKFVNGCAKCELEYNYTFNTTSNRIDFDECSQQKVPNCLVAEGDNCKYCKQGYYLENNKTCNKLIVPKCVNYNYVDYKYHNLHNTSNEISQSQVPFAIYLSTLNKGCMQCSSNYFQLYNYPVEQKQCVSSNNLIEQQYENSSHLIQHCALYEGNDIKKCSRCNSLYIPNTHNTKCISQTPFYRCARVDEYNPGQFICTHCEQGFYLVKNQCRRGTIENCNVYDANVLPMKCAQCKDTYRVSRDGLSCVLGNLPFCNVYENQFETSCQVCANNEHPLVDVNKNGVTVKRCFRDLENFNCSSVDSEKVKDSVYYCNECQQGYYQSDPDEVTAKNMCISISPIQHCKTYDYVNKLGYPDRTHKCLECESGFYVSEYGYSCKVREIVVENCSVFEANTLKCQTCQEGYFLSSDKMTCYPNPTGVKNCQDYSSATTCKKCINNYYLLNNKCLEVASENLVTGCISYNEEQLCVECSQNYYFVADQNTCADPNASGCLTYVDINTCETCPEGTVFQEVQTGDNLIKNCIDYNLQFCLDIDPETRQCNLCATSYYPQEDGTCAVAELIPNCLYYESSIECLQCDEGFYRTADKTECFQTGFHLMNSFSQCTDVVYKDQQQCVACEDGMYFKDGKCVACEVKNCLACDPRKATQCLICQSGFTQRNLHGNCEINLEENIVLPGEDDGTDGDSSSTSILVGFLLVFITLIN